MNNKYLSRLSKNPFSYLLLLYLLTLLGETATETITPMLNILSLPFQFISNIEFHSMNQFLQTILLAFYFIIYGITVSSLIEFLKKYKQNDKDLYDPMEDFENELQDAITKIETNPQEGNLNVSVHKVMKEFEKAIGGIFGLDKNEYNGVWVFSKGTKDWVKVSRMDISDDETRLLDFILDKGESRTTLSQIPQELTGTDLKQLIGVRNCGKLKLGYYVLIYKKDVLNNQRIKEFKLKTSYLLLMGFNKKLTDYMKKVV